jgi:hypothetical protein
VSDVGRRNRPSLVTTASGHRVKSFSEAKIDDWFHAQGLRTIYEPELLLDGRIFVPDWLILPNDTTVMRPILVEYWGLLREGDVADWVLQRRQRYLDRKEFKEDVYGASQAYDFIGIMPAQLSDPAEFDRYMRETLQTLRYDAHIRSFVAGHLEV